MIQNFCSRVVCDGSKSDLLSCQTKNLSMKVRSASHISQKLADCRIKERYTVILSYYYIVILDRP